MEFTLKTERNYPIIIKLNIDNNNNKIKVNDILDYLEKNFCYEKESITLENKDENFKKLKKNSEIDIDDLKFNNIIVKGKYKNLSFDVYENNIVDFSKKKVNNNNFNKLKSDEHLNINNNNENNRNLQNNNIKKLNTFNNGNFKNINDNFELDFKYNDNDNEINNNYLEDNYFNNNNNNIYNNNNRENNNNNNNININDNDMIIKLNKLMEFGFNKDECSAALMQFNGNFDNTLEYLLNYN